MTMRDQAIFWEGKHCRQASMCFGGAFIYIIQTAGMSCRC